MFNVEMNRWMSGKIFLWVKVENGNPPDQLANSQSFDGHYPTNNPPSHITNTNFQQITIIKL